MLNGDGTLANVLVYVKTGLPSDATYPSPTTPVVLAQTGCVYQPRVFGIMVGQPLEIENNDTLLHNVKTLGALNRRFNITQPGLTVTRSVYLTPVRALSDVVFGFKAPEVAVPFACDVHPWMHAYAGVFAHPFFAVTGGDGTFTLSGLPPGTYTIDTWQEKLGTQEVKVTVAAGETKTVDVTYPGSYTGRLRAPAMARHGRCLASPSIDIHRMVGSFAQELAAVRFEVTNEVAPLQAAGIRSGSRMTSLPPRLSSARRRFASRTRWTASVRFERASFSVAPCVLAPGSSSTNPM